MRKALNTILFFSVVLLFSAAGYKLGSRPQTVNMLAVKPADDRLAFVSKTDNLPIALEANATSSAESVGRQAAENNVVAAMPVAKNAVTPKPKPATAITHTAKTAGSVLSPTSAPTAAATEEQPQPTTNVS